MPETVFQKGDVVILKASSDQEFIVAEVFNTSLEVVWFINQVKEFRTVTLSKEVFVKIR